MVNDLSSVCEEGAASYVLCEGEVGGRPFAIVQSVHAWHETEDDPRVGFGALAGLWRP